MLNKFNIFRDIKSDNLPNVRYERASVIQIIDPISAAGVQDTRDDLVKKLERLSEDDSNAIDDFVNEVKQNPTKIGHIYIDGNTLIHKAALQRKPILLQKLIENYGCEYKNMEGDTPIVTVLKKCLEKNEEIKQLELMSPCLNVLVKNNANLLTKNNEGLNAINYVTMKDERIEYLRILLPRSNSFIEVLVTLYEALKKQNDLQFEEALRNFEESKEAINVLKNCMFGRYTLLQSVCKIGMLKSVKRLLKLKLDPHCTSVKNHRPIQLACIYAQPQVLQFLIDKKAHVHGEDDVVQYNNCTSGEPVKNEDQMNLIHFVARYARDSNNSVECLKILLKKDVGLDVNSKDKYGETPLHYAVYRKNIQQIVQLLESNADVNERDDRNQTPLMNMPESALRKYLSDAKLDGMINIKKESIDEKQKLQFKINKIFNEKSGEYFFPTNILYKINKNKSLRKILAHPIFSIIIYFKWQNVKPIYYSYLIFYFFFCLIFSGYIYLSEDHPEPKDSKASLLLHKLSHHNKLIPLLINVSLFNKTTDMNIYFVVPLSFMILILTFIEFLKIRKLITSNPNGVLKNITKYECNVDNLLRLIVIVLTSLVILCLNSRELLFCAQLKALSVLALYIELYFVISKHPLISFYEVVFRKASWHLFIFIMVHIILIIGFAFSFHILFRSASSDNVFTNPLNAIFKSIIMFTGEFDSSDIPFNDYVGVSHAIFITYIFFVTIVLLNLMISIAFRHYDAMERKPFLHQTWAEINHIEHLERFKESFLEIWNFSWCKKYETQAQSKCKNELDLVFNTETKEFETVLDFKMDTNGKVAIIKNNNNKNRGFMKGLQVCRCPSALDDSVIIKAKNIALEKRSKEMYLEDENSRVMVKIFKEEINGLKSHINKMMKSQIRKAMRQRKK